MLKIDRSPWGIRPISGLFLACPLHRVGEGKEVGMSPPMLVIFVMAACLAILLIPILLGVRVIPNDKVGVVEKLWSGRGSLPEGRLIALDGEAGFQAELLRGGVHFGLPMWKYRVHQVRLTSVPQGKIGY